ncbi:glycerophosphoryl diester phosphodiesterase membrane domain-containing protein [Streptomyces purpureus]|uniref:glycerophosphoryl diester phosphodiesterase membrane domain-containing protein n=1 Tax=Streptomyces purpureus TaxID=1951 RepID=UPI00037B7A41|nr:glycerophosphoryl diester phosphodiesterase membrane domain-containing protein [Streptomyces purpureus]
MNDSPGWASPGSAPSDGHDDNASVPRPSEPADGSGAGSKWSKEQPPVGQWSPSTAPGPGHVPPSAPVPGWGGPGRQGGWGQPPAAKPGVIPLRPLGVGEILDGAVSTLRAHWRTILGVTITVSVITQFCDILVQRYLVPAPPQANPDASPAEALDDAVESLQTSLIGLGPTLLIALVGTLVTTALLTIVVSRSVLGRPVTLGEAWAEARPRLPQLLGLTLLLPMISAGIMAVGLIPGALIGGAAGAALIGLGGIAAVCVVFWLMIRFSLASPALMLERQGVVAAMRRSAKLVQGAWWRVFGVLALTLLLTLLVSMIIAIPFTFAAFAAEGEGLSGLMSGKAPEFGWTFLIISGIGAVIASSITYPIQSGVTVLLYVDQRIRREALDLELARSAGLPGYGPASPGHDPTRS